MILTSMIISQNSAIAEGDWDGPKFISITFAQNSIDVSNQSGFISFEVHLADATGVKSVTLQFREGVGGMGGGPDITLTKCATSLTDCTMTGKLIFSKRYRPGIYSLPSIIMSDTLSNRSNTSDRTVQLKVINSMGNPDPNEVLTLPIGISIEDYLPSQSVNMYRSTQKTLNDFNLQLTTTLATAKSLGVQIPDFPASPGNETSLSGDMYTDMGMINNFSMKVKIYISQVNVPLKQLQTAISKAKLSNMPTTIICVKGKITKKVTKIQPTCPSGYKLSSK
jgi:hypothetical protein